MAPEDLPHLIRRFPRALWRPRAEQHAPHPESKGTRDACSAACAGVKNSSSGSAKTSSGKVTVQGPKSWPAQPSATAESSGGENSLSSLVSIPPPPSHTKFSHLTPPAAAVRGLGGGGWCAPGSPARTNRHTRCGKQAGTSYCSPPHPGSEL